MALKDNETNSKRAVQAAVLVSFLLHVDPGTETYARVLFAQRKRVKILTPTRQVRSKRLL